jgi:hypothetical protein
MSAAGPSIALSSNLDDLSSALTDVSYYFLGEGYKFL